MLQSPISAANIFAEIERIERMMDAPEGKGKRTILKAYVRKLFSQYRRAIAADQVSA